ncbi:MAG: DUF1080 domain-containing protein [Microscillaceae bacterium]|nr:DUF1080 domain-containing protein [Microscillaceae bacterium]
MMAFVLLFSGNIQKENPKKWVRLFNGKNLDGWTMKIVGFELGENHGNTFRVEEGILQIRYDQYQSFDGKFGALYYKKKFSDYRLKVEYRFVGETAPGAPEWGFRDSGVQYHCQAPESLELTQPFPVCLEYNLHGGNGKDERPVGQICANGMTVEINGKKNESYCTPAAVKKTFHGDQWVTLEIESRDGKFRHFVNGTEILSFENAQYNSEHEIAKKFIQGTQTAVKEGYISLQSNSHPIDFRKIEIIEYAKN